jgi:hypothetical protein
MEYKLEKSSRLLVHLNQRGFTIEDKRDLDEIKYELALEISEWLLNQFGIEQTHSQSQKFEYAIVNICLYLKQWFVEIGCREIFDVNDILKPEGYRWREFLSSFIHFIKFVDETDKNEEELHKCEKELNEKKFQVEKASKAIENMFDSNEEFELDEKEIALSEQLPALENQFNSLNGSKTRLDTDLSLTLDKNKSLGEDLHAKQKELQELRIQIVRSPEKIAKMQEMTKRECEEVSKK